MPVITISRQLGSLGTEISQLLCSQFDCNYLDKESLEELFTKFGAPADTIDRFDERKPSFWDLFKSDKARYLHHLSGSLYEFAYKQNGIILGRGGQVLLGELPGILKVRICAPLEIRKKRIMKRYSCDERQAMLFIQHNDHERAGFHKFFFDVDWEDLNLYDIVINTGTLSTDIAAQMIGNLVKSKDYQALQEETQLKLSDFYLQYEVRNKIFYEEKILVQFLEVISNNGRVLLQGIVENKEEISQCESIAASIEGVKEVKNEIYFSPITSTYGVHYSL